jgi:hypothetical protein
MVVSPTIEVKNFKRGAKHALTLTHPGSRTDLKLKMEG